MSKVIKTKVPAKSTVGNRYTVKNQHSKPMYLPHEMRCVFAVEAYRSITASANEQIIELELMMSDESEY
jgi:hypothetical protein